MKTRAAVERRALQSGLPFMAKSQLKSYDDNHGMGVCTPHDTQGLSQMLHAGLACPYVGSRCGALTLHVTLNRI